MADNLDADQALVEADPDTKKYKATSYFEDYLYKIVADLGGEGGTGIDDLFSSEIDKLPYFFGRIQDLLQKQEKVKIISADYTVIENEILICSAAVTITLSPKRYGVKVYIKRTTFQVDIIGTIDGVANLTLGVNYASVTLIYTTTWSII